MKSPGWAISASRPMPIQPPNQIRSRSSSQTAALE